MPWRLPAAPTDRHLILLETGHRLQPLAATAFAQLQQAAMQAGFSLRPASSFRDFDRQLRIWNGKFNGQLPLLDHASRPLDALSPGDIAMLQGHPALVGVAGRQQPPLGHRS